MDLEYAERYEAFRKEVRSFLEKHKPEQTPQPGSQEGRKAVAAWLQLQIEHGYWARTIPKEYGGYGAEPDLLETVILDGEVAYERDKDKTLQHLFGKTEADKNKKTTNR